MPCKHLAQVWIERIGIEQIAYARFVKGYCSMLARAPNTCSRQIVALEHERKEMRKTVTVESQGHGTPHTLYTITC